MPTAETPSVSSYTHPSTYSSFYRKAAKCSRGRRPAWWPKMGTPAPPPHSLCPCLGAEVPSRPTVSHSAGVSAQGQCPGLTSPPHTHKHLLPGHCPSPPHPTGPPSGGKARPLHTRGMADTNRHRPQREMHPWIQTHTGTRKRHPPRSRPQSWESQQAGCKVVVRLGQASGGDAPIPARGREQEGLEVAETCTLRAAVPEMGPEGTQGV